jgi:hypothetical protein
VELVFRGKLADRAGKASGVGFETLYVYTPYTIRRQVTLSFPRGGAARRIVPVDVSLDGRFMHYAAAHDLYDIPRKRGDTETPRYRAEMVAIPHKNGVLFESSRPPGWVTFSRPGGEGLQIVPSGDLTPWDAPAGAEAAGDHRLVRTADGVEVSLAALSGKRAAALPRRLVFTASLGLVNLPAVSPRPHRMVMIGNPPFPEDRLFHYGLKGDEPYISPLKPQKISVSQAVVPDFHGGDMETATINAYYPDLVDVKKAKALPDVPLGDDQGEAWLFGGHTKELSPEGYLGAPSYYDSVDVQRNIDDYAFRITESIVKRLE